MKTLAKIYVACYLTEFNKFRLIIIMGAEADQNEYREWTVNEWGFILHRELHKTKEEME